MRRKGRCCPSWSPVLMAFLLIAVRRPGEVTNRDGPHRWSRSNAMSAGLPDEGAAVVFSALGDQTRLRLVIRLSSGRPMSIAQLTSDTSVTRQAVTKHLHVLEEAGLARSSRQGRETMWKLEPQPIGEARQYLDAIAAQWDESLERFKKLVEG